MECHFGQDDWPARILGNEIFLGKKPKSRNADISLAAGGWPPPHAAPRTSLAKGKALVHAWHLVRDADAP